MTTGPVAWPLPSGCGRAWRHRRQCVIMRPSEIDEFCRFAFTFLENQGLRYLAMTVDVDLDVAARLRAAHAAE